MTRLQGDRQHCRGELRPWNPPAPPGRCLKHESLGDQKLDRRPGDASRAPEPPALQLPGGEVLENLGPLAAERRADLLDGQELQAIFFAALIAALAVWMRAAMVMVSPVSHGAPRGDRR